MAETPDLSLLSTSFVKFGGQIIRQRLNDFDIANQGITVYKNVKAPIALPSVTATGEPRPYRAQDDYTTPVAFADRILTAWQTKWDFLVDPEKFRNTYLADEAAKNNAFYEYILDAVSRKYLASINDITAYTGVHNAAGTGAIDLATGWGTRIADEISAGTITPVVTGAITSSNAVAKVALVAAAVPVWMRRQGFRIFVSYAVFDNYVTNYGATFPYQFEKQMDGSYRLNNINAYIQPVSWLGTSSRVIATVDGELCMGTDGDTIAVHATPHLNLIELRLMMPIGFQLADMQGLVVNDQV